MHECVNEYNPEAYDYAFPKKGYGSAINICKEDIDGCLWCDNGEYATRVNFCPFCGYKAPCQVNMPMDATLDNLSDDPVVALGQILAGTPDKIAEEPYG